MKRISTILLFFIMFSLFSCGQKRKENVHFPEDAYTVATASIDDLPAVAVVNTAMKKFEARDVFGWHLSVIIDYKELAENGMPTNEESDFVLNYFDQIDDSIRGDKQHPNAVFIARITHNGMLHAIWQVNNPELANQYLQKIIDDNSSPRPMEFTMEYDATWKEANIHLDAIEEKD